MSEQSPKKPASMEERLSYMAGQVLALNIAVGCLLKGHPDPAMVTEAMQQECEDAMSHLLPSMLDDSFIEGMSLVRNRFLFGDSND
ncbi:hypothetical protein Q8A64_08025 [Oxalobacteraceae bacterium R-40]|uniref:Uncharacterized protein n=1 Tax=Keguizhuia sedimenti TaxID=3064264 RepID=A0ABU1BMX3_9BURK|nr:hypothetical protein [Oxalobacteraceae bacterium R-40]